MCVFVPVYLLFPLSICTIISPHIALTTKDSGTMVEKCGCQTFSVPGVACSLLTISYPCSRALLIYHSEQNSETALFLEEHVKGPVGYVAKCLSQGVDLTGHRPVLARYFQLLTFPIFQTPWTTWRSTIARSLKSALSSLVLNREILQEVRV